MTKKNVGGGKEPRNLFELAKLIERDPHVKKLAEENQKKYGTLTEDDLRKVFTI